MVGRLAVCIVFGMCFLGLLYWVEVAVDYILSRMK